MGSNPTLSAIFAPFHFQLIHGLAFLRKAAHGAGQDHDLKARSNLVGSKADYAKRVAEQAKEDNGVDKYHYRTGKVLHLRPDAPVIDDGCSAPDGGGIPGSSSGYLNIVPGIYLPGHMPEIRPPGYALRIPAGSYLQFQIHYSNHRGIDMKDHTSIGLVFAKEPVKHEGAQYEIWNDMFRIPPSDEEMMGFWLQFADPQLVTEKPVTAQK